MGDLIYLDNNVNHLFIHKFIYRSNSSSSQLSVEKILNDARTIVTRLKDQAVLSDTLIMETEGINERLESMRHVSFFVIFI